VPNFLVSTLEEEIDIGLGGDAEIDSENLFEVLAGRATKR
jgi:hypothetical protein